MRQCALIFILLAAFAIAAEAAQPVAVVLSQPVEASEAKGASGRGAEDVFATAPWDEEHRP